MYTIYKLVLYIHGVQFSKIKIYKFGKNWPRKKAYIGQSYHIDTRSRVVVLQISFTQLWRDLADTIEKPETNFSISFL